MLALSVVLVALIQGVFSDCPEIRNNERRGYPVGSTLVVPCPGSTSLTYVVTCTDRDLWDHGQLASSCSGAIAGTPAPYTPAPYTVAPPAPTVTIATAPPDPTVPTCPFIAGFMRAADAGRTHPQGVVYDMICSTNGGTFPATCQNGAWVYRANACPGIVQPSPPAPTPSVIPPGPIATSSPGRCSYIEGYMDESDAAIDFGEGDIYQMACNPPNELRRFDAVCQNGQWYGNTGSCTSTSGLFGNIFNRQPARPVATQSPSGDPCLYVSERMLVSDAGKTFPHTSQYRLRCVDENSVVASVLATCVDGTWSYDPNGCFTRPSTFQNGLQIGNTNIPIWFFLLGR